MITITIKTNNIRKTVVEPITETPASIFQSIGITPTERNQVSLSGSVLDGNELNKTFAELGIIEDEEVTLSSIIKGDGA